MLSSYFENKKRLLQTAVFRVSKNIFDTLPLQVRTADMQRKHHFFAQLCRTIKKMIKEASYQPLLNPAKPFCLNKNEGLAALHWIPRISLWFFKSLKRLLQTAVF